MHATSRNPIIARGISKANPLNRDDVVLGADETENLDAAPQALVRELSASRSEVADYVQRAGLQGDEYYGSHFNRFVETYRRIPGAAKPGARALELGALGMFQEFLRYKMGYPEIHGTMLAPHINEKSFYRQFAVLGDQCWYMTHNVNFEEEPLPIVDNYFDLVLCCEVIEHMERDPMYLLSEINRVLTPGGKCLLTTPNSTSARIVWAILNGLRPHFFMHYNRNRDLYRHNFEYDPSTLKTICTAAGFKQLTLETLDCFAPPVPEALQMLRQLNFPVAERGDNIISLWQKIGPVNDRYPTSVYA